jgi:hypothetical protein
MMASPKACRERLCGKPSIAGERGFCKDHATHNTCAADRAERYKHDKVAKKYATSIWTVFRARMLRENPICQKINKGVRCTRPSKIGHHIWSPRTRPDLFTTVSNVVMLCENCHTPEESTPYWRAGIDYSETEWRPLCVVPVTGMTDSGRTK